MSGATDARFTTREPSTHFVRVHTRATGRVHADALVELRSIPIVRTEARVSTDARFLYAHSKSTCTITRSAP